MPCPVSPSVESPELELELELELDSVPVPASAVVSLEAGPVVELPSVGSGKNVSEGLKVSDSSAP